MTSPAHAAAAPAPVAAAPSSANAATAEQVASANNTAGLTTSTTINSLADLKKKAPAVYNQMMEGIAMNICSQMQHSQDRLKSMMRNDTAAN